MLPNAVCAGPVTFVAQTTDNIYRPVEIIAIPNNTVYMLEVRALGRSGSDRAGYIRRALIYREGGLAALQGVVNTPLTRESAGTWDVTIQVSGVNVQIVVRGAAEQTVDWQMSYTFEEVS